MCEQDGKELEFMVTYYDHISSSDTKQDWQAVLSIIEALLCKIEVDFPEVERVLIQVIMLGATKTVCY